jgi:hypothetical protein
MPGERRGGRTRATPNRTTILADRIMVVLAGCSMASPKQRLSKLINDAELPAEIRLTVAQKAFSRRTNLAALDALFGIVSDASASAKGRRKAAAELATFFLPKKPVTRRWQFTADECGFFDGEIAREYRAIDFELRALKQHPNRDFPEITQMIRRLQARSDAIRQRLQCPCPTRYGKEQIWEDYIRLATLAGKREDGVALTTEEDAEEAHRKARFDCYAESPEQTARRYKEGLEAADRRFRKSRFFKDGMAAPPLSRRQRNDLWLLRWLYPLHNSNSRRDPKLEAQAGANVSIGHPFHDEGPAVDGKFYPRDSKLRPASTDDSEFVEFADVPRYCIYIPGQPPIFTDEPPNDKSAPTPTLSPPSI